MTGWLLVVLQGLLLAALVVVPHRSPTLFSVVTGGALVAMGAWLLVSSARALGSALTPTPVPNGAGLVTSGPYARVRHPIYSAVLLMATGWVLAVGTWWTALVTLALLAFFVGKARWEDVMLAREYGLPWREWSTRTGALMPRLRR